MLQVTEGERPDSKEWLARAASEREQILDHFPLSRWPELGLAEYALGTGAKDPYCKVLEFWSPHLGSIRGGSAKKHIIFFRRHDDEWWLSGTLADTSAEEAWERLRGQFVEAFAAAGAGDFDRLDELELLAHGPALVTKSLSVYFPDEFLPIYSAAHLRKYIALLGADPETGSAWRLNRQLLALVRAHPVLQAWHPLEVMLWLYDRHVPAGADPVWKIAPGERGKLWEQCLAEGSIRVGWPKVGDLAQYATTEDLEVILHQVYPESGQANRRAARDLLRFRDLQPGTRILANRGQSEVLAVGEVTSEGYRFDEDSEYCQVLGVEWDLSYAQQLDGRQGGWVSTFAPVSAQLWNRIQKRRDSLLDAGTPEAVVFVEPPPQVLRIRDLLDRKGQVILYGAPGTGKTRLALDVALALTDQSDAITAPAAVRRDRITEMLQSAAVDARNTWVFVTDPKQWSWTELRKQQTVEFRRGRLEANFDRMRIGDLVVGYEASPVKKAIVLSRIVDIDRGKERPVTLQWVTDIDGPSYEEWRSDPVLGASEAARNGMRGTAFHLTPEQAEILLGDEAPAVEADMPQVSMLTFHPSYGYEDFVEAYKPTPVAVGGLALTLTDGFFLRLCAAARARPGRIYLLIIDEINRADVPRVFGELITLLEADKRGLNAVLPVSGRLFHVPSNIKIIGTMNTADRSLAHLDSALRRRFSFVPVVPDPDVLSGLVGPVDLGLLLTTLNARITEHLDPDHMLGHSFFLRDDLPITAENELHSAFYDDVVPLLEDFCLNDHALLTALLGGHIVDARTGGVTTLDPEELLVVLAREYQLGAPDDAVEA
ncbi:AAA family ATPase [Actinoplanes sp. CA-252034]|uniref:AAA family ATPase n=1 Tax=Actinoplanes sp. CA-252034 TaxID=3239906 RepID=UPI003D96F0B9